MDIKNFYFCAYFYFLIIENMKTFKKIIATISIVSILALSSIVNAAPLDSAIADITLDWGVGTDTLTVTVVKDFTLDAVTSVSISTNTGASVYSATGSVVTDADGSFTITGVDFDAEGMNTATRYTISFTTANDHGAAVLVVNNDNQFTVSATVQPVLKFAMQTTSDDLGTLTTSYGVGVTTGLEIGTNAVNWVSISAQTTNGWLVSTDATHTINLSTNDTLYSNEGYQFTSVVWTHDSASGATIAWQTATTMNTVNQTQVIYTANMPQNFDTAWDYDVDFTVTARVAESTPAASDYTDVIIFTATANF